MSTHSQTVQQQFDPQAAAYLASATHASGPDLDWVGHWLSGAAAPMGSALDAGSGPGHLSFRLAERFGRVCAVDASPAMLATAASEAARRKLRVATCQADVIHLPFPAEHFDLAGSRFSAHHWRDVPRALLELRRVVRRDGLLLMIDLLGDDSPLVDTHLQAVELVRDPGHVRDLARAEWQLALRMTGWTVREFRSWPLRLGFDSWVSRMRVPEPRVALLREMLAMAPAEVCRALEVEADGSFTVQVGLFLAARE